MYDRFNPTGGSPLATVSDVFSSRVSKVLAKAASRRFSAFTLAELIVVITILAILATVGFLALSGYSQDAKDASVKANARSVYSAISSESAVTGNSARFYVIHDPTYAITGGIVAFDGNPTELSWGDWNVPGTNYSVGNPDYAKLKLNPAKFRVSSSFRIAADPAFAAADPKLFIVGAIDVKVGQGVKSRVQSFAQVAGILPSGKAVVTGNYVPPLAWSVDGLVKDLQSEILTWALIDGSSAAGAAQDAVPIASVPVVTRSVSGNFVNGSWATVTVCGQSAIANASGDFSLTVDDGTVCNDVMADLAGYNCSTFTNWPASLDADVTALGGSCDPIVAGLCSDQTRIVNGHSYPVPETLADESATVDVDVPVTHGVTTFRQVFDCVAGSFQEVDAEASVGESCDVGYAFNGTDCSDADAPSGGSFTLPTYTASTSVTVPVACPTDVVSPASQIQVAIGNSAAPTNWTVCASSVSHTLTAGYGTKDVYVRFRDAAGNVTPDVHRTTNYSASLVTGACLNLPANAKYYGGVTTYSLSSAAPGTSLEASYAATAVANTCQYQCDAGYVDNGGTCALFKFTAHTFTNCGISGRTGPSLAQCQSNYVSTEAAGWKTTYLSMPTNGIQEWTVPETGTYRITAVGAKGGNAKWGAGYLGIGGNWSSITGDFTLTWGQKIRILVGQAWSGTTSASYWAGGGGGTFVTTSANSPLVIAWGGGGASSRNLNGLAATVKKSGAPGYSSAWGTGGGAASGNGGGAGLTGNGSKGNTSFTTTGLWSNNVVYGGFGGGGGGNSNSTGGGGGYSGGGASTNDVYQAGGGGSYNASTAYQSNSTGIWTAHGWVTIELRKASCPSGYYCPDGTVYSKTACPAGKTSPSGSTNANQCELFVFASATFTNCNVTGRTGPTVAQCVADSLAPWISNTAYYNVGHVQGVQLWTVPKTGNYVITAAGAKGGGNGGGRWAILKGTFALTEWQKIKILAGQMGAGTTYGAGGGGTFVTTDTNSPLIVAGGGGWQGGTTYYSYADGTWSTSGSVGKWSTAGLGGTSGSGGKVASSGYGYGGGGITGESDNTTYGWRAYVTTAWGGYYSANAGFGGGGGARYVSTTTCTLYDGYGTCISSTTSHKYGAGGGGWYSGGGGSYATVSSSLAGGGGGSYNSGSAPQTFLWTAGNSGHWYVTVEAQ